MIPDINSLLREIFVRAIVAVLLFIVPLAAGFAAGWCAHG
jgi:hypothetical protein